MPTPPYAPARIEITIPTASYDGQYWGRYPNGDKPGGMAGGGAVSLAAAAALTTGSRVAGGASVTSSATGVLSGGGPPSGNIVFLPGHIARTGSGNSDGFGGQLANVLAFMDTVAAADINHQFVGFCVPAHWGSLESATAGVYDGFGANLGYSGVQQLVNRCKSYSPKRFLMISLNQTGNGSGADTGAGFPGYFCPSYLNSATYAGGAEWAGRPGYTGYPNVNSTFWNINTANRVVAMIQAYYNHFGPYDTTTGNGIYMWELTNEISLQTTSMFNSPEFITSIKNGYSQLRTVAPRLMFSIRPTFCNPGNSANYGQICQAMFNAKIAMANEDGSNNTTGTNHQMAWCDQAYIGSGYPAGMGASLPNHPALGDWAHVFNIENAELGRARNAPLSPVPPADVGSGYIYDNPSFPGMMTGANVLKSCHVIWFLDGQQGPNVNKFKFPITNGTQPANPTPGPGAGLTSARPHLVDVITGNTAYPGITGPIPIPSTTRPPGW